MNIKYKIDKFNYLLRSTAGHGLVLFAMIIVQLFSTTTFFSLLMHEGKQWIADKMPDEFSYVIGFLFALSLEFGIYFSAINGRKGTSNFFAFVSAVLALIAFQGLLYNKSGIIHFWLTEGSVQYFDWQLLGKAIGALIIATYPAIFIAKVSHKLYDLYEKEGYKIPEEPQTYKKNRKKPSKKTSETKSQTKQSSAEGIKPEDAGRANYEYFKKMKEELNLN